MSAKLTISGVAELDKVFKQMPLKMQKNVVRQSTREVAKDVLQLAKDRAPADTGQLEESLTVRTAKVKNKRRRGIEGHAVQTRDGMFQGETFYGGFIELGWKHYRAGHIPADSFLRYALYTDKPRRRQMFASEMAKRIKAGALK